MKIVVAPDSFKESLSAIDASKVMKQAIQKEMPNATVELYPMADGGEGILDTLVYATNGRFIDVTVSGALGNKIHTQYGVLGDDETVVIEIAKIAGLMQVNRSKRNPMNTTTFGIGETLIDAIDDGFRKFIIGLGGSATNDGGLGMLQALGVKFFDEHGRDVLPNGSSLLKVNALDLEQLHPKLHECELVIASDVSNPLCGENGATYVFGAQKGALEEQMHLLDTAMQRYANLIESEVGQSFQHVEGAGAAGGLGFAFLFLGSRLQSGAELVAETIGLREAIQTADWVITGEGRSDKQTLFGKVPAYVAQLAQQYGAKPLLLSGSLGEGYESLFSSFISCFSIVNVPMSLEQAMADAKKLLYQQTRNVIRLIQS